MKKCMDWRQTYKRQPDDGLDACHTVYCGRELGS
jgi:hypothetical protein